MKYFKRLFDTYGLLSHFYDFGSACYLSVHLVGFLYNPQSVSLMPTQWKICSQVSPRKISENFAFSPVSQAVPTWEQGTETGCSINEIVFLQHYTSLIFYPIYFITILSLIYSLSMLKNYSIPFILVSRILLVENSSSLR